MPDKGVIAINHHVNRMTVVWGMYLASSIAVVLIRVTLSVLLILCTFSETLNGVLLVSLKDERVH